MRMYYLDKIIVGILCVAVCKLKNSYIPYWRVYTQH